MVVVLFKNRLQSRLLVSASRLMINRLPLLVICKSLVQFRIRELPSYLRAFEPHTVLDERNTVYHVIVPPSLLELHFDTTLL